MAKLMISERTGVAYLFVEFTATPKGKHISELLADWCDLKSFLSKKWYTWPHILEVPRQFDFFAGLI